MEESNVTATTWLVLAGVAMTLCGLTATAVKVLQKFSRRELELYCRKRKRLDLFGEILDNDEQVMIGTESLQVVTTVALILAGALWFCRTLTNFDQIGPFQFVAGVAAGALVVVAVTVWIPWAVVRLWSAPFLFYAWRVLKIATGPLWPMTLGGSMVNALMRRLANRPESDEDEEEAFEDEIRSIVTEGRHEGLLEEDALEMIEGVIELGDTEVADIMTPRSHVDAVEVNQGWPEILKFMVEIGRTRVPVYEKTLDNVIGVLHVKDLLTELAHKASQPRTPLRELLRKPWFVPTTKPLDEMLQKFQQTRNHLAIVVDEYRSVAGVVTIEDVLEEIVGEIEDESDKQADRQFERLDETTAEVPGTFHIDSVNEQMGLELPQPDEYDTLAGLMISQLGRIPKRGDSVTVDGARLTVMDATRRRVNRLRIDVRTE